MQARAHLTEAEYLALDADAPDGVRYEYDGTRAHPRYPEAMAGADYAHNRLKDRLARHLGNQLDARGCEPVTSDQRVRIADGPRYAYPDVVLVCGDASFAEGRPDMLLNPVLLVEVLSESTAAADTDWKLAAYLAISSLLEYWVVAAAAVRVHRYHRQGEEWSLQILSGPDAHLRSDRLGFSLRLGDLYRGVETAEGGSG